MAPITILMKKNYKSVLQACAEEKNKSASSADKKKRCANKPINSCA